MKFLLLVFLFPLQLFAQDISGVWTGTLYNDTTKQFIKYELAISDDNGKLSGFSHTIFMIDSKENIGVKSVNIKEKDGEISVVDQKLIYNNYPEPPAKGVRQYSSLTFKETKDSLILAGSWHTNQTKDYKTITGSILLAKKKLIRESLIIPKLENLGVAGSLSFTPKMVDKSLVNQTRTESKVIDPVTSQTSPIKDRVTSSTMTSSERKAKENNPVKNYKSDLPSVQDKNAAGSVIEKDEKAKNENTVEKGIELRNSETKLKALANSPQLAAVKPITMSAVTGATAVKDETIPDAAATIPETKSNPVPLAIKTKIPASTTSGMQDRSKQRIAHKLNIAGKNEGIKYLIKLPPEAAAEIAIRTIETIKSVEIKQDSLVLSLFDNGEIDGDTVSVLLNGKVIMPKQGLMSRAINKTIYLTPEMGDSIVLIMYAENLGSIPPNTGLLVIHDGDDIFEIRFAGDLKKNSAIILRRKKKP